MKRSGFRRKTYAEALLARSQKPYKPRQRKQMARASKQPISKLQRILWQLCKELTRQKYGNVCYTCYQSGLSGSNWHTGHLWAKASLGAYLKYDLRVLRPQCYLCNIHHGGRGADFYARMLKEIGEKEMEKLQADRQKTVKAYDHYQSLIELYTDELKALIDER